MFLFILRSGSYVFNADITYNSSRTLPCVYIVDTVISGTLDLFPLLYYRYLFINNATVLIIIAGNITLTLDGNNHMILCNDPVGCTPAISVASSSTMRLGFTGNVLSNLLTIRGNFKVTQ